jgi:hypothetical protein
LQEINLKREEIESWTKTMTQKATLRERISRVILERDGEDLLGRGAQRAGVGTRKAF